jgi:glycerol-1-phosphate dehydrogenase [NAD(P)+]
MKIKYDPSDGDNFWTEISKIPGYPKDEIKPIAEMLFESNAIYKTTRTLISVGAKQENPLILVIDGTPMKRGSDDLKKTILEMLKNEGWHVNTILLAPDEIGQVHTDMPHIHEVRSQLSSHCSVLSVGSGVVTDVAKHACYLFREETGISLPFIVYQTANSVSAYTSCLAPVFMDGVKRTLNSRYPDALICDLETLSNAPREMTVAGVGDMLARYVSLPDWYLANQLGMDPGYTEFSNTLLGPLDEIFLDYAEEIKNCTSEGMSVLAKIIALGGLAMSLSHATTPMSGFEHVMSHVLDLQFEMKNLPLPQHGSQVALATIVGLEMYHHFLEEFNPNGINLDEYYPEPEPMRVQIMENFNSIDPSGKAGAECWSDYKQKLETWKLNKTTFMKALINWKTIKARLEKDICATEKIIQILKAINGPVHWNQLNPPVSEDSAHFAFMNASLMRKRLTIGDLLIFANWKRDELWNQIRKSQEV